MKREYNNKETFVVESPVKLETVYAVIDSSPKEELEITVAVSDKDRYGYFEILDIETEGERFYANGGLWFVGTKLTDYDGVFQLSDHVSNKLKEWGYDVSYVEEN